MNRSFAALSLALLLSGCAITRVYVAPRDLPEGPSHSYTTLGFFWNIIPAHPVNAAGDCQNGVAKVTARRGLLSVIVNSLTADIIIPTQVTVTCLK